MKLIQREMTRYYVEDSIQLTMIASSINSLLKVINTGEKEEKGKGWKENKKRRGKMERRKRGKEKGKRNNR